MNLILVKTHNFYLKKLPSLSFLFFLFFSFSLYSETLSEKIQKSRNQEKSIDYEESLWTNTRGKRRELKPKETDSPLNAVGRIECTNSKGTDSSAGTLVSGNNGNNPVVLFAGHSACDQAGENNDIVSARQCFFTTPMLAPMPVVMERYIGIGLKI